MDIYRRFYAAYGPQHWWPGDGPFEVIAGAILTQSAAWTNVETALANMRDAGCWSLQAVHELPESELAELVRAGLTPFAALRAATVTPGEFIRDNVPGAERCGMVQPGYRADLLLLADNPLEDIANVSSIEGTMVRGNYWTVTALDSLRSN